MYENNIRFVYKKEFFLTKQALCMKRKNDTKTKDLIENNNYIQQFYEITLLNCKN